MKLLNLFKKSIIIIIFSTIGFIIGFSVCNYTHVKEKNKTSAFLTYSGLLETDNKNYSKALEHFYAAIFLDPDNGIAHQGLAHIFYDLNINDLSLIEFEKFINNPKDSFIFKNRSLENDVQQAYCFISDLYQKSGNNEKSQEYLKRTVKEYPHILTFLYVLTERTFEKKNKRPEDIKRLKAYINCFKKIDTIKPNTELSKKLEYLKDKYEKEDRLNH